MSPRFEPAIGRYLHLDLLGKPHRLYVEEAGTGIPLLCLHTAGSTGGNIAACSTTRASRATFAWSCSTCRGMENHLRPSAGKTKNTGSPRATTCA